MTELVSDVQVLMAEQDRQFAKFLEEFEAWKDAGWFVGEIVEMEEIARDIKNISKGVGEEFSRPVAEELASEWIGRVNTRKSWDKMYVRDELIMFEEMADFVWERV